MTSTMTITRKQRDELEGLAYWIANYYYTKERFPDDEEELERIDKTLEFIAEKLDSLEVPFWLQNAVACFAENWRDYVQNGIQKFFRDRGLKVEGKN